MGQNTHRIRGDTQMNKTIIDLTFLAVIGCIIYVFAITLPWSGYILIVLSILYLAWLIRSLIQGTLNDRQ